MNITATNQHTGEIVDLQVKDYDSLVIAWQIASEYEKVSKRLKDELKKVVPSYIENKVVGLEDKYAFKISSVQRMTYDKSILRENLDEDTYDLFMRPDKTAIDKYLKENVGSLGELSTKLRQTMLPDGKPYEVIKLEKLSRE